MKTHQSSESKMEIISPVFRDGAAIPPQYTCKGQNVNPALNILAVPAKTQSLTLVMHDPDAVSGDFLHWLMWDIPPATESIGVNSVPVGAIQGLNDSGQSGYTGPCPPQGSGTHRYIFDFYALDTTLDLPPNSTMPDVIKAMKGHILDHTALTGTFAAEG
ncbi:MAG TPA: YbhB/YbcL family Raf kinase inhibitor-like protein [Candidatus Saccharimonadales bacterium]|nr:YbhB/YbcL family Raf kinase inhibitor-like protein [Candidatus Saccharimonadales bacterium]